MIIPAALFVAGHFLSRAWSSNARAWSRGADGSAGGEASEVPEDDERGNSEGLGTECHTSRTKPPRS